MRRVGSRAKCWPALLCCADVAGKGWTLQCRTETVTLLKANVLGYLTYAQCLMLMLLPCRSTTVTSSCPPASWWRPPPSPAPRVSAGSRAAAAGLQLALCCCRCCVATVAAVVPPCNCCSCTAAVGHRSGRCLACLLSPCCNTLSTSQSPAEYPCRRVPGQERAAHLCVLRDPEVW